ncbi:hypothetical protein JCM19240_699 [Vibrio maritimus]|uniref:EpsG family protein n=1 Tax=Vibrio maritimus TaxID=990268 RepID=A0A090U3Q5_9VIBR|nr:hypothetical protein JCM19240_699 [Vibrio maritimus]
MVTYWLVFSFVAMLSFFERKQISIHLIRLSSIPVSWCFIWLVLVLVIGFRFEVGGDWGAYLRYLDRVADLSVTEALALKDPGYQMLNVFSQYVGGGIFSVNLMAATLFVTGLMVFCANQPRPMLALAVAFPYMVIVLSMGYTRQSIAIGLSMIAFYSLIHNSIYRFSFWLVLACLFHQSAILLIPIGVMLSNRNRILGYFLLALTLCGAYFILLQDSVDALYYGYIESEYQSQGALVRVCMSVVPSLIFLTLKGSFDLQPNEKKLWTIFSFLSITCLILLYISSASTAIDRVALYLLPLQLVVFSHLPEVFGSKRKSNIQWTSLVLFYCALVQFVWLFYAQNAYAWLPYKFYPFLWL